MENFESIRDRQELTFTAINYYKEHKEELLDLRLPGLSGIKYLRSAALFGPNAAGKSTILESMNMMCKVVQESANIRTNKLEEFYHPFLLQKEYKNKPTTFFAAFVSEGIRYEYAFSYSDQRILSERLSAFPKGREQVWYERKVSADNQLMLLKDSSYFRFPAALEPLLNDDSLLLSLVANSPKLENASKIMPVYNWFQHGLEYVDNGPRSASDLPFSGEILDGNKGTDIQRNIIQGIVKEADVGIQDARVAVIQINEGSKEIQQLNSSDEESDEKEVKKRKYKTVMFAHRSDNDVSEFSLGMESDGTYQLFCLSGHIAQALENGSTLLVDELDASLHPILVKELVRMFLNPKSNPNNAQLVFTAHNPCLLNDELLRRDQIWFVEKDKSGTTSIYPLSDFKPRTDEVLISGYLLGRYSATPSIPYCLGQCGKKNGESNGK